MRSKPSRAWALISSDVGYVRTLGGIVIAEGGAVGEDSLQIFRTRKLADAYRMPGERIVEVEIRRKK